MKKIYIAFTILTLILLNACANTEVTTDLSVTTTLDEEIEDTSLTSNNLLQLLDYTANITDAKTLGILTEEINAEEISNKEQALTFRRLANDESIILEEENTNKIVAFLVKTVEGSEELVKVDFQDGENSLLQEELNIQVTKLLVSGDFTFIQFLDASLSPRDILRTNEGLRSFGVFDFDKEMYTTDHMFMSCIISNLTGKIYIIPADKDIISVDLVNNGIIHNHNDGLLYEFYINETDELVFESLYTNKDIIIENFAKDKNGNIFILTENFSYIDEENNIQFLKTSDYKEIFLSENKNVWAKDQDDRFYCFSDINESREIIDSDDEVIHNREDEHAHELIFVKNMSVYSLFADEQNIQFEDLNNSFSISLQASELNGSIYFYYFNFLYDYNIIFNDYNNNQLVVFDLSNIINNLKFDFENPLTIYDYFSDDETTILVEDFEYTEDNIEKLLYLGITYEQIELNGTNTYLIYLDNNIPKKVLYSTYDAPEKNTITMQPIN